MTQSEDDLRHLLQGLADAEPLPDEVADRLDTTMARLVAARPNAAAPSRRRWMTVGVVAAALVGIAAVGVGAVQGSWVNSGSSASAGVANDAAGASVPAAGEPTAAVGDSGFGAKAETAAPSFTTSGLARQVRAWWAQNPTYSAPATCPGPWETDSALSLAVHLDGSPAALVVFPAQGDSQLLEIFACDAPAAPAAQVTVPAH